MSKWKYAGLRASGGVPSTWNNIVAHANPSGVVSVGELTATSAQVFDNDTIGDGGGRNGHSGH